MQWMHRSLRLQVPVSSGDGSRPGRCRRAGKCSLLAGDHSTPPHRTTLPGLVPQRTHPFHTACPPPCAHGASRVRSPRRSPQHPTHLGSDWSLGFGVTLWESSRACSAFRGQGWRSLTISMWEKFHVVFQGWSESRGRQKCFTYHCYFSFPQSSPVSFNSHQFRFHESPSSAP